MTENFEIFNSNNDEYIFSNEYVKVKQYNFNFKVILKNNDKKFIKLKHTNFWKNVDNYETENYKLFDKLIKKNDIVLDIGACVGKTALYLSKLSTQVYAFEPNSFHFNSLKKNIYLNNIKNIIGLNCGLLNETGTKRFYNADNANSSFYIEAMPWNKHEMFSVNVIDFHTFDKLYFKDNNINFVKIDIEGGEIDLIPHIFPLIKKYKPFVLISLHESIVGYDKINNLVKYLLNNFPYCYETNLTDFTLKKEYMYGDHSGCDILCSFVKIL
tara:strand:+ start:957 stop:1766 length:810 start_codon:yes stop_codon:yes gene_type:complete